MEPERKLVTVSARTVLVYGVLAVIFLSLWAFPLFLHIRAEYRPYDETVIISGTPLSKSYIERLFVVYRPWETNLRLTGKYLVEGDAASRVSVMDWENYNNWKRGGSFRAVYRSELKSALTFDVALPADKTEYYLLFENPSSAPIELTYDAGINFERAYLGYAYTEWISRVSIVLLVVVVLGLKIRARYAIRIDFGSLLIGGFGVFLAYLFVSRFLELWQLWTSPF